MSRLVNQQGDVTRLRVTAIVTAANHAKLDAGSRTGHSFLVASDDAMRAIEQAEVDS